MLLHELFPEVNEENSELYSEMLEEAMGEYAITTRLRKAMFLAQTAHESGFYKHTVENLYYTTPSRLPLLFSVFRKKSIDPAIYTRNPEKLANLVYANRNGNGGVETGDGWAYRGRGF